MEDLNWKTVSREIYTPEGLIVGASALRFTESEQAHRSQSDVPAVNRTTEQPMNRRYAAAAPSTASSSFRFAAEP
jgi:hypothetical protein